jgi:processive 1,2-diacylglycerol beta-glucosyltransferase
MLLAKGAGPDGKPGAARGPGQAGAHPAQTRHGKPAPLFAVMTDFYAHSYWPARGVELYFSPGRIAEKGLKANGVDPARIISTGIPVRKEFIIQEDARQKRKELNLSPNLFTILLIGGSKGLGDIPLAAETLKKLLGKLQLIILCGDNKKLCGSLEKTFAGAKGVKLVPGFVEYPADYFKAADLIVSKAGGLTIAEAMALNKPILLFSSFPGQEERNTRFLIKNHLADFAEDTRQLESQVRRYLLHPGSLAALRNSIAAAARPRAAGDITARIMEHLLPGEAPKV